MMIVCNKICWARTSAKETGGKKQTVVYIYLLDNHLVRSCSIMACCPKLRSRNLWTLLHLKSSCRRIRTILVFPFYFSTQLLIASVGFFLSGEIQTQKRARERERERNNSENRESERIVLKRLVINTRAYFYFALHRVISYYLDTEWILGAKSLPKALREKKKAILFL